MRRKACRNCCDPAEQGDDRQQECGLAPRQDQENNEERTGRNGNDSDRPPACVTPHRESHGQRRKHPGRNDQQECDRMHPSVPGSGTPTTEQRRIDPEGGKHQRHPKQREHHDRKTARPPVRQLIAHCDVVIWVAY